MSEPPDPGGTVPPVGYNIVIDGTTGGSESGMDTDCSVSQRPLKRSRINKICKSCNKRRRKHNSDSNKTNNDCHCNNEFIEISRNTDNIFKKNNKANSTSSDIKETSINGSNPHQSTSIGRHLYENTDNAPYIVHVQRNQTSPNDGSTLHPITFGNFLKKNNFRNIINGSVKRIGRNKISLAFSSFIDANSFIDHNSLVLQNLKAFIPTFNVTRMGLVRGVPAEWSPEDVLENVSVPIGCGKIIKIRRLNFKVLVEGSPVWKPSQTVVITFDGQILPKRVFMCYNALPVEMYIYPTIQCFACCRFGHTKVQCRSKPRCYKCGQGHTGESCNIDDCGSCCLCSGHHFANSKSCPEHNRQKEIKLYMAKNCTSYAEASKLFPPVHRSFADVVTNNTEYERSLPLSSTKPSGTSYKKNCF